MIQDHAVGTHRLVAQEVGADEVCVDDSGSVVLGGSKAPDEEDELASEVEGEPEEQQVCMPSKLKSLSPANVTHTCTCLPEKNSRNVKEEYTTQYVSH